MWFIKIDNDATLENVCDAIEMEPKALFNPLHQNILNIILRHPEDKSETGNLVYTNITLSFDSVDLQLRNGVPYGEIDKDITGISLYIDEDNYDLADSIMNCLDDCEMRAMMTKI